MTRRQLSIALGCTAVYLAIAGWIVVACQTGPDAKTADAARSIIPLVVALPAAGFAFFFPARLDLMCRFHANRTRALEMTMDLSAAFGRENPDLHGEVGDRWGRLAAVIADLTAETKNDQALGALASQISDATSKPPDGVNSGTPQRRSSPSTRRSFGESATCSTSSLTKSRS